SVVDREAVLLRRPLRKFLATGLRLEPLGSGLFNLQRGMFERLYGFQVYADCARQKCLRAGADRSGFVADFDYAGELPSYEGYQYVPGKIFAEKMKDRLAE